MKAQSGFLRPANLRRLLPAGGGMISLLLLVETCPFFPTAFQSPVAQVTVVADSTSLLVGSETQVTATVTDANGNVLTDRSVTWSSSDTAVAALLPSSPTTALAAALAEGSATITAASEGKSGASSLQVTAPEAPPPSEDGYPNQPAGYTAITGRPFAEKAEDGWTATTSSGFSIVSEASAPKAPPTIGQMFYPAGKSDYDPGWTERSITSLGYGEVYVSFWVKVSSNWQGHKSGQKIGFAWIHDNPTVVFSIRGAGSDPLRSEIYLQNIPGTSRILTPNLASVELVRGRWHRWEVVLIVNSGDNTDGQVHWWVDGTKVGEYRDVAFGSATQGKVWQLLSWRPIWGGQGDTLLEDQYMWMDHYYASGL